VISHRRTKRRRSPRRDQRGERRRIQKPDERRNVGESAVGLQVGHPQQEVELLDALAGPRGTVLLEEHAESDGQVHGDVVDDTVNPLTTDSDTARSGRSRLVTIRSSPSVMDTGRVAVRELEPRPVVLVEEVLDEHVHRSGRWTGSRQRM
jgi:hypothetical protein